MSEPPRTPADGDFDCGQGHVIVVRNHPAFYSRSPANADSWRAVVRRAVEATGGTWQPRNYLQLRRGPYLIAAVLDESLDDSPLQLRGLYLDLLDPLLAVHEEVTLRPGEQAWLMDLQRVSSDEPLLLAAAGRVEDWKVDGQSLQYHVATPADIVVSARIRLATRPSAVFVNGNPCDDVTWDERSRTVLIRHDGRPEPVQVKVQW